MLQIATTNHDSMMRADSEMMRADSDMHKHSEGVVVRSLVIGLTAFLTVVDLFVTQAILPSLARHYGVTPAAMGFAVNASTMGMAVAGLAIGFFSQRIDRRLGILVSLALLSLPTVLLASPPLPPCGDVGFRLAGWRLQMHKIAGALIPLGLLASLGAASQTLAQEVPIDRTMLPIPQPIYPPVTELDARNVKPPPFFEVKAPDGAPNVLIVLIDDMGFGQSSAFGGPVHMPTVEALANEGLRFNEFHTTALCSPTRTALLTGRNHHMNNMGSITETATAFQGNTGVRPNSVAPLAEMLRLNDNAKVRIVEERMDGRRIRRAENPYGIHLTIVHCLNCSRSYERPATSRFQNSRRPCQGFVRLELEWRFRLARRQRVFL